MSVAIPEIIEREVLIAARPETVFPFFTDPAKLIKWKGLRADLEPRPGGLFRVVINEGTVVSGRYVEITPPRRVVFTWGWEGAASPLLPGASTVEITLTPEAAGTRVRLRHSGLPTPELVHSHIEGWEHFLPRLTQAAEGQDPGPDPWSMAALS